MKGKKRFMALDPLVVTLLTMFHVRRRRMSKEDIAPVDVVEKVGEVSGAFSSAMSCLQTYSIPFLV
jgi:hypothetical protein